MQERPKKTGSAAQGANSASRGVKKAYTPDQREQYRAYYESRQRQERAAAAGTAKKTAAPQSGTGAASAKKRTAAAPGTAPSAGRTGSAARTASSSARSASAAQRTSAARGAGRSATGAVRRAASGSSRAQARRGSAQGGGNLGGNAARMLLVAAAAVLLMFGLIKLIGHAHSGAETDYVPPMKTEDYLAMLASAQPEVTEPPLVPEETEGAPDGVDITEPPADTGDGEPDAQPDPDAGEQPEPSAGPQPEEGFFPGEDEETESVPAPTSAPVSTSGGRTARLRFAGDVVVDKEMLTTAYNSKTQKYSFKNFFGLARDLLSNADMTAINVDGSMGGEKYYKYGYSGYPQFNTPPTLMYALLDAGVDMLTLANNHCLDGWWEGFKQQINNADYVGLMHIGGFRTQEEHDTPEIYEINGIKVGFLNYTQSYNSMDSRGVDAAALKYGVRGTRNADYAGDIKRTRAAGAEVVVVVMHWGKEYLTSPDDNQKTMAKQIAAAGADVIVGGHPHVAQVGGWISATTATGETNNCLIIYSLGNFLTEHRNVNGALRTDWGVVLEFTLQENLATGKIDVVAPKYLPVGVWRIGSPGSYDWRVVSVDAVLANRPAGMSDAAYQRFEEISLEAESTFGKSDLERIGY